MRFPEEEGPGKIFVDGSACKEGSGAGVVLVSPKGDEVKLVVHLDFQSSNNEAEYKDTLAGLQAAVNVGAWHIHVFSDSQLVTQHVNGLCEVKTEKMIEYINPLTE